MKHIPIYAFVSGLLFASAAQANDLGYMIDPKPEDHKIPVAVNEVEKTFWDTSEQKEFVVEYETPASHLSELAPAAGGTNAVTPQFGHYIGH